MAAKNPEFDVIYAGKKYDIKKFLRDHPGGVNTLKSYKGKSVSDAMKKFGHSTSAYHMLKDFEVENSVEDDINLTGKLSVNGRIITREEEVREAEEINFLEELEGRLDYSRPLLAQLDHVADHYDLWVNTAVYRKCRLFENPIVEALTYTPWFLVPGVWIPIILYLSYTQFQQHVLCADCAHDHQPISVLEYLFRFATGVFVWTLLEYSLHRWVFHLDPGSSLTMKRVHFLIHGIHHKFPFDGLRQVFPPVPAMILTVIIYQAIKQAFKFPVIVLAGGILGYLTYDMIHYYVHHGSPKDGSYLYTMKRYHSNHHFMNHDKAFGISSNIWDYVFKTFVQVRKLGFSLQW